MYTDSCVTGLIFKKYSMIVCNVQKHKSSETKSKVNFCTDIKYPGKCVCYL